ncbi:MAG: sodium:calcium exchanger [Betaproteobacteria bacterium]|nr:sodium:calcium exchanger [Betaproteobacteria bacterium]
MVTTVSSYTDARNRALIGDGYDGVVRVVVGNMYGTGVLLYDGKAVLTAAHLFAGGQSSAKVMFETMQGSQTLASSDVLVHPDYNAQNNNADLALVWLSQDAPTSAQRYGIYRQSNEVGQTMTLVGYGTPGLGSTGVLQNFNEAPVRVKAQNQFDTDVAPLGRFFSENGTWEANNGKQLVADFDNGLVANDALGALIGKTGLGLGSAEGLISKGDSGGPAFIGNVVAGIASYTARLSTSGAVPDIDNTSDSSFGEVAVWQRVSVYQQWIDQSLRMHYAHPPATQATVQKSVNEGNTGTTTVYFWVQFNGIRFDPNTIVSVDYKTRNGTALAGQDYLATQGTLKIYPNEDHALVAVEILADTQPEADETFYLDVFNPVGASFENGLVQLTAVRTIVNDDGWYWG